MINLVLDDDTCKSWESEDFFFSFFVKISEFYRFVSSYEAFFRFWKRETTFLNAIIYFFRNFQNFWIEHHTRFEALIFPAGHETCNKYSFCDSNLWSCETNTSVIRIFNIFYHFLTKFYIFFPFGLSNRFTYSPEDRIVFSSFYFECHKYCTRL